MNRLARRARAVAASVALTLGAMSAAAPIALAAGSPVPFKDTNIDGTLTFCTRGGQPVTSGSIDTVPFAWKAISSAPPPACYRGASARATLDAYQPLQYVDPGDWSGSQLTAASLFSNPDHPVAQATNVDQPLLGFTQAYPLHWDGLVEIRMLFTAVDKPQLQTPYAAAVLRVTGSTWTMVSGGGSSCSQGRGESVETLLLPKKDLAKKETIAPAAKSSTTANASGSPSRGGSSANSAASGNGNSAKLAANSSASTGTITKAAIGLVTVAFVAVVIGAIAWRRRRSAG